MQSEAFRSMFLIVKGSIGVYQQNGEEKTKLCVLSEGDTFGDITCASGLPRDCSLQAEADCTLMEWSKRDLNGVLEAAHHVLKNLESFVRWAGDAALRTDATTFAPAVNSTSVQNIALEALKTFRYPASHQDFCLMPGSSHCLSLHSVQELRRKVSGKHSGSELTVFVAPLGLRWR